jgi:hypothetical protein
MTFFIQGVWGRFPFRVFFECFLLPLRVMRLILLVY